MVSIAVASCLHMDSTYIGHFDPELKLHTNWYEALSQLGKIVHYCNKNTVDFLVLNGDVFHTGRPTPEAVMRLRMELDKLDTTRVIMEPGNHDLAGINSQHADPLTAYFSGARWCEKIVTQPQMVDLDGFALAVMPWFRVSGYKELDEVSQEMEDETNRMADEVVAHGGHSLFVGHLTTLTAHNTFSMRGSEKVATKTGLEAVLDEKILDDGPWSRYALGHIHTRQTVGTKKKGLYTGSTHRVTFTEEKEKKGFYLYEYKEDGRVKTTFCNLGGRKLATADLSDTSQSMTIPDSKYKNFKKGDYFRLVLPHDMDLEDMPESVQETYWSLFDNNINMQLVNAPAPKSVKTTTSIPIKEEVSPEEVLDAYISENDEIGPDRKKELMNIFAEVESDIAV